MPTPSFLSGAGAAVLLAGCTSQPTVAPTPSPTTLAVAPAAALSRPPRCLQGATARLRSGAIIRYQGADRSDPEVCLVKWLGRTRRLFMGFWGSGRYRKAPSAERAAVRDALMGPVGTRTDFRDSHATLWARVTIEHVADPMLTLASGPRPSVQLRVVRHDAFGRANNRVSNQWVDRSSGALLKRQTVTTLASGEQQAFTTWRVTQIAFP